MADIIPRKRSRIVTLSEHCNHVKTAIAKTVEVSQKSVSRITELGICAYCAQIAQLRIKAYFFRVVQFALHIYKAICVCAICAFKK